MTGQHALSLLSATLERADESMVEQMRSEAFKESLAHVVAALIDILSTEKLKSFRALSARTLRALCACVGRKAVYPMVPGIVSTLTKVCMEDFKSGSAVLSAALDAFTTVLRLSFMPSSSPPNKTNEGIERLRKIVEDNEKREAKDERDEVIERVSNMVSLVWRRRFSEAPPAPTTLRVSMARFASCAAQCRLSDVIHTR